MLGTVNISVRELVEFTQRNGSIDSGSLGSFGSMGLKRAQEGTAIHTRYQKARKKLLKDVEGTSYESEVFLRIAYYYKDFEFAVEGRADGVLLETAIPMAGETDSWLQRISIDEIKSTSRNLEEIDPPLVHWAQAKCYGFMLAAKNMETASDEVRMPPVTIRLLYIHTETEQERCFEEEFSFEALAEYFEGLIEQYYAFAKMQVGITEEGILSAKQLVFPYPGYRKSQRELAVTVYGTIKQGKKLFVQAPTGTGKTISTLFPAIKALGEDLLSKVFVLTAKTITRQVTEDAFLRMHEKGLRLRLITLIAKEKICFKDKLSCNPESCEFANGHFDRINTAILDVIQNEYNVNRSTLEAYAQKHRVCPFEYALDLTYFCQLIVCDYNYVYNPRSKLKRFFGENNKKDFAVLHDEAHNLVDRAREMFSSAISREDFRELARLIPKGDKSPAFKTIRKIRAWFKTSFDETKSTSLPKELCKLLTEFKEQAEEWFMIENRRDLLYEVFLELYFRVLDFLRIAALFDERYVAYYGEKNTCKLLCLDPSYLLAQAQKQVSACVFFSATLSPLTYFQDTLGGASVDYRLCLPSPFSSDKLCVLINDSIYTGYKNRQYSYEPIARNLFSFVSAKRGNYLVFFSSYEYLQRVAELFTRNYPDIQVLLQEQSMNELERQAFLDNFSAPEAEQATQLGFAVLGGSFSEGIDLVGDRLIGVVVVGVGLPMISEERNLLVQYYNEIERNGFEFAYTFPGFNKVMQAVGRLIRSENDKGAMLLIDSRFTDYGYQGLFPAEWRHFTKIKSTSQLEDALRSFWN